MNYLHSIEICYYIGELSKQGDFDLRIVLSGWKFLDRQALISKIFQLESPMREEELLVKYMYIWDEFSKELLSGQLTSISDKQIKKVLENSNTQLGRTTNYVDKYDSSLLFPVSRQESRDRIGNINYEFSGLDIWNAYEFSGLDSSGKPFSNILQIAYDCKSTNIVESKSLKLYLNSFNQTSTDIAITTIAEDLGVVLETKDVRVCYKDVEIYTSFNGDYVCVDKHSTDSFEYKYNPSLLQEDTSPIVDKTKLIKLYSNLLKSNCRHTKQPDWGTVYIDYVPSDNTLDEISLLKYIVSYRSHNEFHEECCERIMYDIINTIKPKYLKVVCKYTRRGGIDINPIRIYDADGNHEWFIDDEIDSFTRSIRQ